MADITLAKRPRKRNDAPTLTADARTLRTGPGSEVVATAFRDEAGELVRLVIAVHVAGDLGTSFQRAIVVRPSAVAGLAAALRELAA